MPPAWGARNVCGTWAAAAATAAQLLPGAQFLGGGRPLKSVAMGTGYDRRWSRSVGGWLKRDDIRLAVACGRRCGRAGES